MAQANEAVWLPVLPSFKDFGPALVTGAGGAADKAGAQIGQRFGKALTVGIAAAGAGAMAAGAFLYKVGEVFDDVTDTIRVGTGASGEALDGLVDSAKRVGQNVPASFEQVGTTVADINTRMGLSGETLETVASQYLEAGRILGEDVDINKTSAAFNAFGIEGEAVVGAMDHLFQVSQATGVGMNELAGTVSANAPAMKALGFSFEETAVMAGSLDKAGLNSNKMMAAMSKGLVTLAKDGEAPQEAFKRVIGEIEGFIASGDEAAALELAGKVFGTKGAPQFLDALKSGALNLDDLTKAAGQTSDSILDVGAETMDFAEAWQLFKNNVLVWLEPMGAAVFGALGTWMGVAVDAVGAFMDAWGRADGTITQGGLLGFMEALSARVQEVYGWFQNSLIPALAAFGGWVQQNSSWLGFLAVALGAAGAAVGILVGAFKAWAAITKAVTAAKLLLTTSFAQLNTVMAANPIGVVIVVLAALVAAAIYAYQNFEWFRQIVDGAWNGIKAATQAAWEGVIRPAFEAISTWITGTLVPAFMTFWQGVIVPAWEGISAAISAAWNGVILPALSAFGSWITGTLAPAVMWLWQNVIVPAWAGISAAISAAWTGIIHPVLSLLADGIRGWASVVMWLWQNVVVPAWAGIAGAVSVAWSIISVVFGALTSGVGAIISVVQAVRSAWSTAWSAIASATGAAWAAVSAAVSSGVSAVTGLVSGLVSGVLGFFSSLGSGIASSTSSAWAAVKGFVSGGVSAVTSFVSDMVSRVTGFFSSLGSGMRTAASGAWDAVKSLFSGGTSAVRDVVSGFVSRITGFFGDLKTNIVNRSREATDGAKEKFDSGLQALRGIVDQRINDVLGFFRDMPRRIKEALGDLGNLLRGSGEALLNGFKSGMESAFGGVKEAAKSGLESVRRLFPFSPAKEGPFSGRGYTTYSGRALSRDFADAIAGEAGYLERQAETFMSSADLTATPSLDAGSLAAASASLGWGASASAAPADPSAGAGFGFPSELTLVLEDGTAFPAYLAQRTDARIRQHVDGLAQPLRQHAGA
ncbi:phage tail tape measure protein [Micrococcus luteus]|uniref:phage tail tape measure protein n=2 Tax=Micrococcus TaxID=1269 RepID=UPI003EB9E6D9